MPTLFKTTQVWVLCALASLALLSCRSTRYADYAAVAPAALILPDGYEYGRQWQPVLWAVGGDTLAVEVKGRGHSTFAQPKHPYVLRFPAKWALPGMPPHRRWVLLANFFDHSLLRNALAAEVARQTSLADVAPRGRFVSLTANGQWQGIYWLCERVKQKVAKTDSLLQLDVYHWQEQQGQGLASDTLPSGVPIDTLSVVDWWLVHELCMNAELNGPRSCYFRLTEGDTLRAGPVWDFDMAFNEVGVDNGGDLRPTKFKHLAELPSFLQGKRIKWLTVDSLYLAQAPVMQRFLADEHFRQLSKARWQQLRPRFRRLTGFIDYCARLLNAESEADQELWNAREPARFDGSATWNEAVRKLKGTYQRRLERLDNILAQ